MTSNYLDDYGDILKPEDIQKILCIGRNTVYKYLAEGEIKSIRIANKYRIPKKYLIDFIYSNSNSLNERTL